MRFNNSSARSLLSHKTQSGVVFRVPVHGESAEDPSEGFFTCYEAFLTCCRMWFPIPEAIVHALDHFELSINQLNVAALQNFLGVLILSYELGMDLSPDEFEGLWSTRKTSIDYSYRMAPKRHMSIIQGHTSKAKGWFERFFYVRIDSASVEENCLPLFRGKWNFHRANSILPAIPRDLFANFGREIGIQEEVFYACDLRNFAGEELCSKPCAENLAVHSVMTSGLVELALGIILELVPGPGISGCLSLFGVDSVIMLALEIFSLVVDIPVVTRVFPSRGRLLRVVLLGEDFHLFFHHDEVCCLVKSVLDCSLFFKGYPLPEFRPVLDSFPQSVDCHFVADSILGGRSESRRRSFMPVTFEISPARSFAASLAPRTLQFIVE
ncbi:hypothetical protein F2Q70_00039031 [Brassica cretica]|uniref:Uncharacterized protein n=1 Tax=Brassica cretica TaxID=69181 RepID=A0A8S9KA97_BRACR|nr:hypothetical protein F2Q70_00039031 [Brassica cretica]